MKTLRIATRQSALALWQAEHVRQGILRQNPDCVIELVGITTEGDRRLDVRLDKIGGKGLFVKELENALLENRADIAVHSMKDMPVMLPDGLHLPVILKREDARDIFVSNHYQHYSELPKNAIIGTSSLRRQSQLLRLRPDLTCEFLRGNVPTRIAKLEEGQYHAIILAHAGVLRLGMADRITQVLTVEESMPAAGQGAIGIECRAGDDETLSYLNHLHDSKTASAVLTERAMNQRLAKELPNLVSICQVPIAAYAEWQGQELVLSARVLSQDGRECVEHTQTATQENIAHLGPKVAEVLCQKGALKVLAQ